MRSANGGCVANKARNGVARPLPKNMWLASSARGVWSREPCTSPPIFFSAPAMPSGSRVNCTAEASARNSRCRETALLINCPKKTPM